MAFCSFKRFALKRRKPCEIASEKSYIRFFPACLSAERFDMEVKMPTEKATAAEPKKLKITLIKSTIGAVPKNRAIVKSMGFKKLNSFVILPDNAATRGQIRLINHMVKVEELD
jgi:large subunit ribosomal protein L30